jgi:hypothetical protein
MEIDFQRKMQPWSGKRSIGEFQAELYRRSAGSLPADDEVDQLTELTLQALGPTLDSTSVNRTTESRIVLEERAWGRPGAAEGLAEPVREGGGRW